MLGGVNLFYSYDYRHLFRNSHFQSHANPLLESTGSAKTEVHFHTNKCQEAVVSLKTDKLNLEWQDCAWLKNTHFLKVAWFDCRPTKIQMLGGIVFTFSSSHQLTCCVTLCGQCQGQGCFCTSSLSGLAAQQGEKLHRETNGEVKAR